MTLSRNVLFSAMLATGVALAGSAQAHAPSVTITSPATGTVVESTSFPASVDVSFVLNHSNNLAQIKRLGGYVGTATVFEVSSSADALNPFAGHTCSNLMALASPPVTTCAHAFATRSTGTVGATWTVPAPGTYVFTVQAQHGNDTGSASIEVTFVDVSVDEPAPPAIANAYIKDQGYKLTRAVHGCVISAIADGHNDGLYGPKGGPYDVDAIHADVEYWIGVCSAG